MRKFSSTPRGTRLARRLAGQRLAPDRSARKAAWRMIRREKGLGDDV
jgi:hypothetical protein